MWTSVETTALPIYQPATDVEPPMASITCGCGFRVQSHDLTLNRAIADEHTCYDPHHRPDPWRDYLFSAWGVLLLGVLLAGGYAILALTLIDR